MDTNYVNLLFFGRSKERLKTKKKERLRGSNSGLPFASKVTINFSNGYREITSKLYKVVVFLLFTKNRHKHDFKEQ